MKYLKLIIVIGFLFGLPSITHAASRFWVGGTGNWSDNTNHWSATSGGSAGASKPGVGDTATFDASSGGGTVTFDETVSTDSITMGAFTGTIDTNNQTVNLQSISISGTGTRTLTMGSSAINLSLAGTAWAASVVTNLTITANTATVTISGTAGSFISAAKNYNGLSVAFTGSGSAVFNSTGSTFANVTRTSTAVKTDAFDVVSAFTVTGTLTLNGNSSTNRLFVKTTAIGTAVTITNTGATMSWSNVDFRDITLGTSYDASAITGLSGDAGGNTNITFTSAQTQYWVGDTGSWSTAAEWGTSSGGSGGRVPLPQDDVVFDGSSFSTTGFTVTLDMPRAGKNITWGSLGSDNPAWAKTTATTVYGSVTMVSGMTNSGTTAFTMEGRTTYNWTNGGQTFTNPLIVAMVNGTLTLLDAFLSSSTVTNNRGTIDADTFNFTSTTYTTANVATAITTMGSGTWTVTTTGTVWSIGASSVVNAETSTIVVSNTTATSKTFAGAGKTYNNFTITGDDVTITGNNTFNVMALNNPTEAEGLIIGTGSTQTISSLTTSATIGNIVLLFGVASGGAETISDSSGSNCLQYITVTNITASGGATFYAENSSDGGGNSGWNFTTSCPANPNTGTHTGPNEKVRGGTKIRGGVKFR